MDHLATRLESDPRVMLAVIFGSAMGGTVRDGSDVDIGVLLSPDPTPQEFYVFYQDMAARLGEIAELDLIDLSRANSVLAFEVLRGRRLVVRDAEVVATFVSQTARQYEDDMLHADALRAA